MTDKLDERQIAEIENRNTRTTGAMQSICGEYHCDCHNDVPNLIATIRSTLLDKKRLDWLDADNTRLEDVRGRMNNEDESVREAIDALRATDSYVTPEQAEGFLDLDDSQGIPAPYIKRAAKMLDKNVVFEQSCLCGRDEDPTGRLPRLDIVCPKHDGAFTDLG